MALLLGYDVGNSSIKATLMDTVDIADDIHAIEISYQMHGLDIVDKNNLVHRPSIIWCDSQAVQIDKRKESVPCFDEAGI